MHSSRYPISSSPHRGELVPIGVLEHFSPLDTFRLVYPTLCVGSSAQGCLWIWDMRTRENPQVINFEPYPSARMSPNYVDVNETHVFVVAETISVYNRSTGECDFQLHLSKLRALASCTTPACPTTKADSAFDECEIGPYQDQDLLHDAHFFADVATAIRVSPSGDDFVVSTISGYIYRIYGLKNMHTSRGRLGCSMLDNSLDLGEPPASIPEGLNSSNDELPFENFTISVASIGVRLDSVAYDGSRILAYGVSSPLAP